MTNARNKHIRMFGEMGLKIRPDIFRHYQKFYFEQSTIFSFSHKKEKGSKTHLLLILIPM